MSQRLFLFSLLFSLYCYPFCFAVDDLVTIGSVIKLRHKQSGFRLHSHDVKWGSGSGQQSVTAYDGAGDVNSYFQVKDPVNGAVSKQGSPIKCGSKVRLQHTQTKRYLHSHLFSSPISNRQEVSCFGEGGQGDRGDNWILHCVGGGIDNWVRERSIKLQHVDTSKYLSTSSNQLFTQYNCPNCPINGQQEVSAWKDDGDAVWTAEEGIYFGDDDNPTDNSNSGAHDDEF